MAIQRIGLKKTFFRCQPEGSGFRGAFGILEFDEIPDELTFVPIAYDK